MEAEMRKKTNFLNLAFDKLHQSRIIHYHGIWLWGLFMCLTGCSFVHPNNTIISEPIALHKAGSVVEANFEIEQNDSVGLHLWFFVNDQPGDRDRLLDFLGRFPMITYSVPKSVTVPLKVKLIKYIGTKESVILDKTYATSGLEQIGKNQLSRRIDMWRIESGSYRIRLETIEEFPKLSNTKVQFTLYYIRAPK
jgi:hypothetical protein